MSLDWKKHLGLDWDSAMIRDLWRKQNIEINALPYTTEVIGHEAKVLRVINN